MDGSKRFKKAVRVMQALRVIDDVDVLATAAANQAWPPIKTSVANVHATHTLSSHLNFRVFRDEWATCMVKKHHATLQNK